MTRAGSRALEDSAPADADAPVVARLRRAGLRTKILGYDHNWVLDREGDGLELAARLSHRERGREVAIFTTEPGRQVDSLRATFDDGGVRVDADELEELVGPIADRIGVPRESLAAHVVTASLAAAIWAAIDSTSPGTSTRSHSHW